MQDDTIIFIIIVSRTKTHYHDACTDDGLHDETARLVWRGVQARLKSHPKAKALSRCTSAPSIGVRSAGVAVTPRPQDPSPNLCILSPQPQQRWNAPLAGEPGSRGCSACACSPAKSEHEVAAPLPVRPLGLRSARGTQRSGWGPQSSAAVAECGASRLAAPRSAGTTTPRSDAPSRPGGGALFARDEGSGSSGSGERCLGQRCLGSWSLNC